MRIDPVTGLKRCSRCKKDKPASAYTRDRRRTDELRIECSECYNGNRHIDREKAQDRAMKWREDNHQHMLWLNCRHRAYTKKLPFTIKISDIVIPDTCPVCGVVLQREKGRGPSTASPSVDMYDPGLGYIKDNSWVICLGCNRSKWNMSGEEHVTFGWKLINAFKEYRDSNMA